MGSEVRKDHAHVKRGDRGCRVIMRDGVLAPGMAMPKLGTPPPDPRGWASKPNLGADTPKPIRQPEPKGIWSRFVIWQPYSEAECIELYRRVWGKSWDPVSLVGPPGAPDDRSELIRQHMIVVEKVAGKLLAHRQSSLIEKGDLLQAGYEEMIRTIDRPPVGTLALEKRIARNCKTAMIRFITDDLREQRYILGGKQKAIRDTRVALGVPNTAGYIRGEERDAEVAIELDEEETELDRDNGVTELQPTDQFLYLDWLRGLVLVVHRRHADHFEEIQNCDLPKELAEIAHQIGYGFAAVHPNHAPRLRQCLRAMTHEELRAYAAAWAELLPDGHAAARGAAPSVPYRGLFWPPQDGRHATRHLLRDARQARPATTADAASPAARFSILKSRTPVY